MIDRDTSAGGECHAASFQRQARFVERVVRQQRSKVVLRDQQIGGLLVIAERAPGERRARGDDGVVFCMVFRHLGTVEHAWPDGGFVDGQCRHVARQAGHLRKGFQHTGDLCFLFVWQQCARGARVAGQLLVVQALRNFQGLIGTPPEPTRRQLLKAGKRHQ